MKVMVMVKATKDSEAGVMPSQELLTAMGNYNEELVKAGVMLAGEGLQSSSKGARVRFSGDKRSVIDGPFAETKEALLGFYVVDFDTLEEAVAFSKELSTVNPGSTSYEIRPFYVFRPGVSSA